MTDNQNPNRCLVKIPPDLVEKCWTWASEQVEYYRNNGDRLTAMPWTRDLMTHDELRAWRASRKEAARKIDIETCEIGRWYANANGDPYGIGEMLGEEDHLDKGYVDKFDWVRSPDSNGWICESDLPREKIRAFMDRINREYALAHPDDYLSYRQQRSQRQEKLAKQIQVEHQAARGR